jgi:ATP/maltotriose-dependent transcriptional regulator MalT/DNA-binding SARP family transcriptional activator
MPPLAERNALLLRPAAKSRGLMGYESGQSEEKQASGQVKSRPRSQNPASVAKITRPLISSVIIRGRLFDALDKTGRYSLTWVRGPAGAGKTTLVASYLSERKAGCIWYRLDKGDSDIATFFYYMGLAARKAAPHNRDSLPLFTSEYSLGVQTFTLRYFERLYSRLKPPFFIVLDDYHHLPSQSALHQVLYGGIESLPEGVRFIILSREGPPAQFARTRASGRVGFVSADEMRLTIEETKAMAELKGLTEPTDEAIRTLHEKTRGWAAGMVLLMEAAEGEGGLNPILSNGSHQAVFDYLAIEMFEHIDAETRRFLMQTAFMLCATARMAFKLTGMARSGEILARLSREVFFTEKNDQAEPVYGYHPLFRDFLLEQAKKSFGEKEIRDLKSRSASIMEEWGDAEEAVKLFIEGENWPEATRLIMARAPVLFAQGRARTVLDWMATLAPVMFEKVPYLLFWQGRCRVLSDPARAVADFKRAYDIFASRRDFVGMSLSWAGAAAAAIHGRDYLFLEYWIPLNKEFVRENLVFPEAQLEARVTVSLLGVLMFHEEDRALVARIENKAYLFFCRQDHEDIDLYLQTGVCLTSFHLWMGNIAKATGIVDLLRGLVQRRNASDLTIISVKTVEALWGFFTASFDSSRKKSLEVLDLAEKSGVYTWYLHATLHGISSALASGDAAGADVLLEKMRSNLDKAQAVDRAHYYFCVAWKARLQKDLDGALANIELCRDLLGDVTYLTIKSSACIASAEILFRKGERPAAQEHLREAYGIGRRLESSFIEYACLALDAHMKLEDGYREEGLALLAKAFALGREHSIYSTYWWQPENMTGLCMAALYAGIETGYARSLVERRSLVPAAPPVDLETWPWPVRIYTLGEFELQLSGETMLFEGKPQKKPLALLKALIALGGRQVKEEHLIDMLWPEAEGDHAMSSFTSALLRLRRLLGFDKALEVKEGRLTLNPRYCWVDAWAFETMANGAEALSREGGKRDGGNEGVSTAIESVMKAVGMYRGPFLPDEDFSWAAPTRERLAKRFRRLAVEVGNHLGRENRWEAAAGVYEGVLEKSGTADEEVCRRLMVAYQRLDRKSDAVETYRRCERALKEAFGARPAPETNALYHELLK